MSMTLERETADCLNCHDRQIAKQVAVDILLRMADLGKDVALLLHNLDVETSASVLASNLRHEAERIARQ